MTLDLVPIWTLILAVGVFMYVLLDGFDLGVGILFPLAPDDHARDLMMASVAPVWDGNETWLVLGGIALFAAFPLAFAIIMPALYFPILAMLLGLIFRGVAFEFRPTRADEPKRWDAAFFWGSLVATFAQGCVLGKYVQGFPVEGRQYAGSTFDCLHPFVLARRRGARLRLRAARRDLARDEDRRRAAGLGARDGALVPVRRARVHRHGQRLDAVRSSRGSPRAGSPGRTSPSSRPCRWSPRRSRGGYGHRSKRGRDVAPFVAAMGLFAMCYAGLAISLFPYIVPPSITLWDAASRPQSQAFLLIGTLFLLPIILMYTGWSYWVFRGKVRGDIGYH